MKKITPYVIPRPFNGYNIPIAIQTSYIRSYCQSNGFEFTLPLGEYPMKDNYSTLIDLLNSKKKLDIVMVSIFALPLDNTYLLKNTLRKFINNKIVFHGALESKKYSIKNLLKWSDQIFLLRKLSLNYDSKEFKLYKTL